MNDRRTTRARRGVAVGGGMLFVAALVAGGVMPSSAAWLDTEWVAGDVATLDCTAENIGTSTGGGTLLGGTLLGLDLGTLAEVRGIRVTDGGGGAVPDPASSTLVPASDGDAYQNPLVVSAAFGVINTDLGGVLQLPLETELGVYGQYGRASGDASSAGAAGLVTQGGAIDLDEFSAPPEERPRLGTLELGEVLEQALGEGLSDLVTANVTDLRLDLGAVASAVSLDGCASAWSGTLEEALLRDYAIAGLDLDIDSPLASQLTSTVTGTLDEIEVAVEALAGDAGLLSALADGILGTSGLGGLLALLTLGTPSVDLALDVDFSAVDSLLDDTISDDEGIVEIDLATGGIRVDLAALVGEAYGTDGLNGLAPNTEILLDDAVTNPLLLAVGDAIDDWAADVDEAILDALSVVHVDLTLEVPVSSLGYTLAILTVETHAGLDELLAGTATVTAAAPAEAGLCSIPALGSTLCGTLNALVGGLTPAVLAALGPVIGATLTTAIDGVVSPLLTTLGSTLAGIAAGIVSLLSGTLSGLFGEDGLLGLLVNAQNDPASGVGAGPEPAAWAGMPGPAAGPPPSTGRYDVAALRLTVLGAAPAVELELARSTAGSNVITG